MYQAKDRSRGSWVVFDSTFAEEEQRRQELTGDLREALASGGVMLHYQPVVELGAVRVARSPDELAGHVNDYLADPSLDRAGRRRLLDLEVGVPLGTSTRRIVRVLEEIAA